MGWYTILNTDIVFCKETYATLEDVEDAIEEEESLVKSAERELLGLAVMTEPNKMLCLEDGVELFAEIENRVNMNIETIKESEIRLYKLNKLKSEWNDCHVEKNGKIVAKNPPEDYNPPYLCGDYIKGDRDEEEEEETIKNG